MGRQLNSNEIYSALSNMIISMQTFADNINGLDSSLADSMKTDGTLYGDTKGYVATDILRSYTWNNDAEAANLLKTFRPPMPKTQYITLDVFKQIPLTLDDILSKRAWGDEGSFSTFSSVMQAWMGDTKRVYDKTTVDAFVGTNETTLNNQTRTITLPTDTDKEAEARLQATAIAELLANIEVELADINTVNDFGFTRSWSKGDLEVVWNAEYKNKILKRDLPTIFHKDGLIDFEGKTLPKHYFGVVVTTTNVASYTGADKVFATDGKYQPTKGKAYAAEELDITVGGTAYHLFAGQELPANAVVNTAAINAGLKVYVGDENIIFKIIKKGQACPYMSAFEQSTSFFNAKALLTNYYLTFGHNTMEHLKQYPWITVRKA